MPSCVGPAEVHRSSGAGLACNDFCARCLQIWSKALTAQDWRRSVQARPHCCDIHYAGIGRTAVAKVRAMDPDVRVADEAMSAVGVSAQVQGLQLLEIRASSVALYSSCATSGWRCKNVRRRDRHALRPNRRTGAGGDKILAPRMRTRAHGSRLRPAATGISLTSGSTRNDKDRPGVIRSLSFV
jgi:hypothetical protein